MRYALIDAASNTVGNVIEMAPESDWAAPKGMTLVASTVTSPGDVYELATGAFALPARRTVE